MPQNLKKSQFSFDVTNYYVKTKREKPQLCVGGPNTVNFCQRSEMSTSGL